MTRLFKITVGTAVVLLLGLMMSCNSLSDNEMNPNQGKGTVVFKITDAPFPVDLVEEANVTIDWIKLLKYPAEDMEEEAADGEEVILVELLEPETYNLLELRNGLTATMAEMDIPVGSYAEIRLHVTDAGILLKNGTSQSLKVPGGDASGIKIKLEPALDVLEGVQTEVLVDFDLSRSFVMRGNSNNNNGFIFKPVVRAVANAETTSGEISGTVTNGDGSPVAGTLLTLLQEDEVKTTATTEDNGYYSMMGILPGNYDLVLEVSSDTVSVLVETADTKVVDFIVETAAGETSNENVVEGGSTEETSGE